MMAAACASLSLEAPQVTALTGSTASGILLGLLAVFFLSICVTLHRRFLLLGSLADVPLVVFGVLYLVSVARSSDFASSFADFLRLVGFFGTFVLLPRYACSNAEHLNRLSLWFVVLLVSFTTLFSILVVVVSGNTPGRLVLDDSQNANAYSQSISASLGILIMLFVLRVTLFGRQRRALVLAATALTTCFLLYISYRVGARSVFVSTVLALGMALWIYSYQWLRFTAGVAFFWLVVIGVSLPLAYSGLSLLGGELRLYAREQPALARVNTLIEGIANLGADDAQNALLNDLSVIERKKTMRAAYEAFLAHPLVGGGYDIIRQEYGYVHNLVLELASEMGLLGLVSFLWILIVALARIRSYFRCGSVRLPAIVATALMLTALVQAQFSFTLWHLKPLFLAIGIALWGGGGSVIASRRDVPSTAELNAAGHSRSHAQMRWFRSTTAHWDPSSV
jgi:hypothetical protein